MAGQTERNNEIHLIGGETGTWFVFLLNSEIIGNFGIIVTFFLAEPSSAAHVIKRRTRLYQAMKGTQ